MKAEVIFGLILVKLWLVGIHALGHQLHESHEHYKSLYERNYSTQWKP